MTKSTVQTNFLFTFFQIDHIEYKYRGVICISSILTFYSYKVSFSITREMTKLPLYGRFLEGSGMQFQEHLMVDTIEPTIRGTLAESDTEDVDI